MRKLFALYLCLFVSLLALNTARGQTIIYSNVLGNGFQDWGWATINYSNTSPVYTGCTYSISVTMGSGYQGIQIVNGADLNTSPYGSVSFWLNGGGSGGQHLQIYAVVDTNGTRNTGRGVYYALSTPTAGTWTQYTVPLSSLGVSNIGNFTGIVIQDSVGTGEPVFYLDNIQLNILTPPATTAITVNANEPIRTADARWFALNATIWDNDVDTTGTIALLTNMGIQSLRFPGGSDSDDYHWPYNRQDVNNWTWTTSLAGYIQVITNMNAKTMITLNYGTGTSNEAAAWVAYCNAATTNTVNLGVDQYGSNWRTAGYWANLRAATPLAHDDGSNYLRIGRSAPLGFKYWEVGNELYGSWETDNNSVPHDPYTYAVRAKGYIDLIKAVDPTVKVGVVVTPFTNGYSNNYNHPAVDPVTGYTNYGWTPVLLATLKNLGETPDFAIFHNYIFNPGGEFDVGLLVSSGPASGWAFYAANLRGMISDYMGSAIGTNIELVCTENNSVSSSPGKQSVSLVGGLYKIDSLAALMQTEFNGLFWWALRNGQDTGNDSSYLYGWREYGDYGVVDIGEYADPYLYPTYYTTVLATNFAQTGDTVLTAASAYPLLSAYAVKRTNGSLTVLVVNKTPTNTLSGQVTLSGFTPGTNGVAYFYGIPQDTAVENSGSPTGVTRTNFSVSGTNVSYTFPPYSATVLAFSQSALTASAGSNQTICAGGSAAIGGNPTASGGAGGYSYSWSPSTGLSSATVANPTASPASTTTYTVTVTDSALNTAQSSVTVTVHALPTVSVNSATICAGGSATLTATNNASSPTYLWSPGGATTQSITISPASTTTYTVTVTDGTTGCANTGSGTVTVHALPTVSVNSATVCAGGSATLTATNNASSPTYLWSPGGATTQSITISPASTTTYTVTVTDGTTGCANTGSGTVTVHALPTVSVNSASICAGGSATLTATNNASSPAYLWSPGGATTQSITVSPASTTTYTVTVTDGTTGCANTGSGTVTINALPTITLGANPTLPYHSSTNASLAYTATSGSPNGYSVAYDTNAQAAGFSNVALATLPASPILLTVPIAAGTNTYTAALTLNNSSTGCSSTNYPFTVTVTPLPVTLAGSRLYDGTATANASILTIATNYDGTNLTLSGSATLAGSGAGVENITDFSGLTLGGTAAGNYTLTGAGGSVTVNPLPVVLTGSRPYDGTATAAAGILSVSNAVGGDNVYPAGGSANLAGASVGPEAITSAGTLTLGGAAGSNYTVTGLSGTVTVINPFLPFTITSSSLDATGTNFVVCWQSIPGVYYNVLTNTGLSTPQVWTVLAGPILATNTNTCYTLPGGITGQTNVNVVIQQ